MGAAKSALAIDDLVREHGLSIGRVCMALLGEQQAAQAATGEVFVRILDRLKTGSPGRGRAWMYGIVRAVCALQLDGDLMPSTERFGSIGDVQHAEKSAPRRARRVLAE